MTLKDFQHCTKYFTNPALNLRIGGSVYARSDQMFLNGYMDEMRFLKRKALSPDEIAETYPDGRQPSFDQTNIGPWTCPLSKTAFLDCGRVDKGLI